MLDLKRLRYLNAVYQYKSFTRAGEELFVSQPAISTAVHSMEKELGIHLLDSDSRGVVFTLEGELFMTAVSRILRACEEAESLAVDLSDSQASTLRVGFSPSLDPQLLPHLYRRFLPQWPKALITVSEFSLMNCIDRLQTDQMDLAYNALPDASQHPGLRRIPVTSSEICVVLPQGHPLAKQDRISIQQLDGIPAAMLEEKAFIRSIMLKHFKANGVFPKIISQHEQISGMLHMVEFGNCICFLNRNCGSFVSGHGLCIRPFDETIRLECGFLMKSDKRIPKLAQELISFTINTVDSWSIPL